MVTPARLKLDAEQMDSYLEAFEQTYLHYLDVGTTAWSTQELDERNRATAAFYLLRDLTEKLIRDMNDLAGHMEVCNAIYAAQERRRGGDA